MTESVHNLQFHQVRLVDNDLHVTFITFKHYHGRPITLILTPQKASICPVSSVKHYLKFRGFSQGPFFSNPDGTPVKYSQFLDVFRSLNSRVQNSFMSPHSLRIGAATYATMAGYTQGQVTQMGRWHSDAVLKYFRVPSFKVSFWNCHVVYIVRQNRVQFFTHVKFQPFIFFGEISAVYIFRLNVAHSSNVGSMVVFGVVFSGHHLEFHSMFR